MANEHILTTTNTSFTLRDIESEDLYSIILENALGTFDTGVVQIQVSDDGVTFTDVVDGDYAEPAAFNFLCGFNFIKFALTGGNGSTSITVRAKKIHHR